MCTADHITRSLHRPTPFASYSYAHSDPLQGRHVPHLSASHHQAWHGPGTAPWPNCFSCQFSLFWLLNFPLGFHPLTASCPLRTFSFPGSARPARGFAVARGGVSVAEAPRGEMGPAETGPAGSGVNVKAAGALTSSDCGPAWNDSGTGGTRLFGISGAAAETSGESGCGEAVTAPGEGQEPGVVSASSDGRKGGKVEYCGP
mmetsp:Transcript_10449/g.25241  ORF Transcript_10449/g.25241 Transcript_10449/m.25241 type:complete len:202 (-) Transcript_10449:2175-2780(-)